MEIVRFKNGKYACRKWVLWPFMRDYMFYFPSIKQVFWFSSGLNERSLFDSKEKIYEALQFENEEKTSLNIVEVEKI